MGQRKYLPKRVSSLRMWQTEQLQHFVPQWKILALRESGEDIRPLLQLMKDEFDLALETARRSLSDFLLYWAEASRNENLGREEEILRSYIRLRMCWHVNYHWMRPKPYSEIQKEADARRFYANNSKPKPGLFRLIEGRGSPRPKWTFKATVDDVVNLAEKLTSGPERLKYRVKRYYRDNESVCYPPALKKDIAAELGIDPRTVDRKLLEALWLMPDDLVYGVQ